MDIITSAINGDGRVIQYEILHHTEIMGGFGEKDPTRSIPLIYI